MGDTRKKNIDQTYTGAKDQFIAIFKFILNNSSKDSCKVCRLLMVFPKTIHCKYSVTIRVSSFQMKKLKGKVQSLIRSYTRV